MNISNKYFNNIASEINSTGIVYIDCIELGTMQAISKPLLMKKW